MLTALNLSLTRRALASGVMVAGGLGLAAPAAFVGAGAPPALVLVRAS